LSRFGSTWKFRDWNFSNERCEARRLNAACLVVYAAGMKDETRPMAEETKSARPDFAAVPSAPRARRWVQIVAYLLLLALACAAIWWIYRGANLTNSR